MLIFDDLHTKQKLMTSTSHNSFKQTNKDQNGAMIQLTKRSNHDRHLVICQHNASSTTILLSQCKEQYMVNKALYFSG